VVLTEGNKCFNPTQSITPCCR